MPTNSETTALTEPCEQLTNTQSVYPGTNRILRYRVKTQPFCCDQSSPPMTRALRT